MWLIFSVKLCSELYLLLKFSYVSFVNILIINSQVKFSKCFLNSSILSIDLTIATHFHWTCTMYLDKNMHR